MSVIALRTDDSPITPAGDLPPDFADFWILWPKRVAKSEARQMWLKLTDSERVEALTGLADWLPVWSFQAREREDFYDFLPNPDRWLRRARWEDEIPERFRRRSGNGNGAAACQAVSGEAVADSGPRIIPEHVRALIAKIKAQGKR